MSLCFAYGLKKLPPPFVPLLLISMQCTMGDRNHHQHGKRHYRPPSSSYEMRDSLSSSQCSPYVASHLTRLIKSNWHPTPHLKNSICDAYAYVMRADAPRVTCTQMPRHWVDIATTDFLPSAESPSQSVHSTRPTLLPSLSTDSTCTHGKDRQMRTYAGLSQSSTSERLLSEILTVKKNR